MVRLADECPIPELKAAERAMRQSQQITSRWQDIWNQRCASKRQHRPSAAKTAALARNPDLQPTQPAVVKQLTTPPAHWHSIRIIGEASCALPFCRRNRGNARYSGRDRLLGPPMRPVWCKSAGDVRLNATEIMLFRRTLWQRNLPAHASCLWGIALC